MKSYKIRKFAAMAMCVAQTMTYSSSSFGLAAGFSKSSDGKVSSTSISNLFSSVKDFFSNNYQKEGYNKSDYTQIAGNTTELAPVTLPGPGGSTYKVIVVRNPDGSSTVHHPVTKGALEPSEVIHFPTGGNNMGSPNTYLVKKSLLKELGVDMTNSSTPFVISNKDGKKIYSNGMCTGPNCKNGFIVTCSSVDKEYQFCPVAKAVGNPILDKRLSDSKCVLGSSFGKTKGGVWVDKGCSGRFAVQTNQKPTKLQRKCSSPDYGLKVCPLLGVVGTPKINKQLSGADCVSGKSFGSSSQGIWVDKGCRAVFDVVAWK